MVKRAVDKLKSDRALLVGFIGMALLQSNMIPQTLKILSTGDVSALSVQTFVQTFFGLACYLYNALKTKNTLYIVGNIVGLVNVTVLLIAIFLNK